ncbi:YIP1 family protein [Anaerobacillus sp. CMMVII]|uniref:YIP1 family protein n=1 Tax=Anaerobacillus sp. CMMVII TaxID=2755588 RepID=UPI0021B84CB8|nr:YIP1 family protein [Anaerobacillus sp. CMMVII]MCT8139578.1 YIP1 family protein [Anaerobacillus sp. CMMVII]
MKEVILIFKALILDKEAIQQLSEPKSSWKLLSMCITVLLGLVYGYTAISINSETIASFETPILRQTIVPGLFLFFGILMILITKVGLSLLLWAGSKGLSGRGLLGVLYRNTTFALIPSVIALPAFISLQVGTPMTPLMFTTMIVAVLWIYLICSKVVEVTQQFVPWRAYVAVLLAFIFYISIYYIVLPPS